MNPPPPVVGCSRWYCYLNLRILICTSVAWERVVVTEDWRSGAVQVQTEVKIQVPGQKLHDSFITFSLKLGWSHPNKIVLQTDSRRWFQARVFYPLPIINVVDLILILDNYLLAVSTSHSNPSWITVSIVVACTVGFHCFCANLIVWTWIELLQRNTQAWKCGVKGHGDGLLFSLLCCSRAFALRSYVQRRFVYLKLRFQPTVSHLPGLLLPRPYLRRSDLH